jgi:hypothetical protein
VDVDVSENSCLTRRRRGEGKRSAVFTAFLALVRCWLIASACRPVTSASGCRLEQTGLRLGSYPYLATTRPPAASFSVPRRDGVHADLERREFERQTLRTLSVRPLIRSPQDRTSQT